MPWLTTFLTNPWMLGLGAVAVLSPIIIHLLNKRRFKIVDWAAMDFLFDADKQNRRRVRLENLILLLLRCLAMLLLGLLLARPFLPSGVLGQSQQYQRIILLDDSLSQQVKVGSRSAFELARDRIKQLLQKISTDQNSDFLTLYLTSDPDQPVLANEPVTVDSLDNVISQVDELQCSDQVARYTEALDTIHEFVESNRATKSQVVYVLTDLRKRDWLPEGTDAGSLGESQSTNAPHQRVQDISQSTPNTFIVDVGSSVEGNLAITEVIAEDLLVAGTIVRFNVAVTNFGESTAENVRLRFRVDEFQPQTETIESIPPSQTRSVTFRTLFQHDSQAFQELDFEDRLAQNLVNHRIQVEIIQQGAIRDALIEDSEGYFAARSLKGIPILIVDGDPSAEPERSESYYLRSLGIPGTGILVDTATIGEFETISLSKYKVIFLCNVDEASPDRVESLRQWVTEGGGLVFMPGDRVRASTFNRTFYKEGKGLSPMKLEAAKGDVDRGSWIFMEVADPDHPALRVVQDQEIGFDNAEIFSWWHGSVSDDDRPSVSTPLLLGNQDKSPAMVDRVFGEGRTVTMAVPADADWTMWPADPTYICVMWDLINDMVGKQTTATTLRVGGTIRELVDLSQYELRVGLVDPAEEKMEVTAKPMKEGQEDSVLYAVEFPPVVERGFYELQFQRPNQETVTQLFAVNVDPAESNLTRVDVSSLPNQFFGEETRVIDIDQLILLDDTRSSNEIWPQVLLIFAGVLILEQFLGWWFGRRR